LEGIDGRSPFRTALLTRSSDDIFGKNGGRSVMSYEKQERVEGKMINQQLKKRRG
jgi:hypothetical protein